MESSHHPSLAGPQFPLGTTLLFASNNPHKTAELNQVLAPWIQVKDLPSAGIRIEIPEPYDSLEENAKAKCLYIHQRTTQDCLSEDSGLEVDALGGLPGVRSARFSDPDATSQKNIDKVLALMQNLVNRTAQFRTVICLNHNGQMHQFVGVCKGRLTEIPRGAGGFGYDPIFIPDGSHQTFAEMTAEEKSKYSHRAKAANQLLLYMGLPQISGS